MPIVARNVFKPALGFVLSLPLLWLAYLIYLELISPTSGLGPDPAEGLLHFLGEWSLIMLLIAFSVTPLRRRLRLLILGRCRRMAGLFAFTYVVMHLVTYMVLYVELSWALLLEDFYERTYITAGMASFLILLMMALTSTRGWQLRLGRYWRRLHTLIFAAVPLALLHLLWLRKDGYLDTTLYALWFAIMVLERLQAKGYLSRATPPGAA
ncbi:MAG TPA: sulfoxide reductase heme-binding subunit YedZ [Gammaproteobacteria bacterium]|nr:MAG: sulfoxide reductase heme-binding subunit YedZ [OM182 bacterium]HAL42624.1 sulfoxide reductase heme-binding subunit YedZ [Gammaproteobacteria bacterium]